MKVLGFTVECVVMEAAEDKSSLNYKVSPCVSLWVSLEMKDLVDIMLCLCKLK